MSALPPLPVRVVPLPAETVRSFYRRLCGANGLSQRDLWLHIRHLEPNAPLQLNPSTVPHIVSMLGGLPPLYLPDLTSDRECKGHEPDIWSRLCPRCCGSAASASTMCRRCAHGDIASLHLQTGPICVKHRRWHLNGLDLDVSTHRAQLAAQRVLNGSLRMRQIHYRSLEAGAVRELIHGWKPPLARTDHQIALKEELEALPLLVWMLTELSTQFMIEILKDKTVPSLTLATVLHEFRTSARERRPIQEVVAAVLEREAAGVKAPDHAKPELLRYMRVTRVGEEAMLLRTRVPALRANLLDHVRWQRRDPLWTVHDSHMRVKLYADELRARKQRIANLQGREPAVWRDLENVQMMWWEE